MAELSHKNSPLVEWLHLRIVNGAIVRGAPATQVISYLQNIPARTNSAVLNEKLGDIFTASDKPISATEAYEHALTLSPSPEQKIRLRLAIGELLKEQAKKAEAIDNYKKLLAEAPDYPGKGSVLGKIAALEQKDSATNSASK